MLRPYSDDYKSGELKIDASVEPVEQDVRVRVKFEVSEPSILNQIKAGNARCVATLYCHETLHKEILIAGSGQFAISANVHGWLLVNSVDIHPAIVAVKDIMHPTHTAHDEYGGQDVQIGKFQPLAITQIGRLSVNAAQRPAKSVFNLVADKEMPPDIFDVEVSPSARYINIKADEYTLGQFKNIRKYETLTLPSVYMNALMEALAYVKASDNEDDAHSNGWMACIKDNLHKHDIRLGSGGNEGSHSLIYAAQMLLDKPFGDMIRDYVAEGDVAYEIKRVNENGYNALQTLARNQPDLFMTPDPVRLENEMIKAADTRDVWEQPLPVRCSLDPLNELQDSGPGTDYHYAKIVRQALGGISLADAADKLLWASINCFAIADYVSVRWQTGLTSKTDLSVFVDAHWIRGGSDRRIPNAAARLWWLGELSERVSRHSQYSADKLLNVMANNVNLYHQTLARPYLLANPRLTAAIYEVVLNGNTHLFQTDPANDMYKSLIARDGASALDMMDDDEIRAVVEEAVPPKK